MSDLTGDARFVDPDVVAAFLVVHHTFRNIALTFVDREAEAGVEGAGAGGEAGRLAPLRILLAEDNPINREIMLSQLTAAGHAVAIAADGEEALQSFAPGKFDLVLTDIEMPGMDGFKLAEAIRRMGKEGRTVPPILAITASEFELTEA